MIARNWKTLAEFAGIFAIVVGLFFVYEELRLSRAIARADLSSDIYHMLSDMDEIERDPEFSAILVKSYEDPELLNAAERVQLNSYLLGVLKVYLRENYNFRRGIFEEWTALLNATAPKYFGNGYGRAFWNVRRQSFRPEIVSAIDEALENSETMEFELNFDREVVKELGKNK